MHVWEQVLAAFIAIGGLAFFQAPRWAWSLALVAATVSVLWNQPEGGVGFSILTQVCVFAVVIFLITLVNVTKIRRLLLTGPLFKLFRKILPPIRATELEAINAGDIWWEADLFRGRPPWKKLFSFPKPQLSVEEQLFLDNQVEVFCSLLNDWEITQQTLDLPSIAWKYLKEQGFFGLIIPKEFGGKDFSALANSTIVQKISTRSVTAAVTTMVPNSLGPAELLLAYGTEEQKHYYLPKLASGEEIPCFALTGPEAGSDASAIPDIGVVCKGKYRGKEMLGMRLTWDKRYITLAPVATVLGLAVKLYDPEGLIGDKQEIGITLCLLPTNTEGVEIGKRHFPLNQPFLNGPTRGKDVFVPLDFIIGGVPMAGKGWRMLVECLSAGRGISLPALSTACAKHCYRVCGAYAKIRKQFHTSIGRFEGVEAALAQIGGITYLLEATRLLTLTAIDQKIRPAVVTAIAKYHMTEFSRKAVNHAMDIHGGRGIMLGPNNYLGRSYESSPISITVEGANILTRNLIIFGQGILRCHPFLQQEMQALSHPDQNEGIAAFDKTILQHVRFFLSNVTRLFFHSLTAGQFCSSYALQPLQAEIKQLSRMSLALSCISDFTLLLLGGRLKRRERLSARLGDVLSYLFLASAVLKYFNDFGDKKVDLPYVRWTLQTCLFQIQKAFLGFFHNLRNPLVRFGLKCLVFPYGRPYHGPKDKLDRQLARHMMLPSQFRDRLTSNYYLGKKEKDAVAVLEYAFKAMVNLEPLLAEVEHFGKTTVEDRGNLSKSLGMEAIIPLALKEGVISKSEANEILEFEHARRRAIAVDEFSTEQLQGKKV